MALNLGTLATVAVSEITYDLEKRGRESYGDVADLARSIKEHGLIHPIAVYSPNLQAPYALVAGCRRLLAVKSLEWSHISVRIYDEVMEDARLVAIELYENLQRQNLSFSETVKMKAKLHNMLVALQAERVRTIPDQKHHSIRDTAFMLGESHATVIQDMKLAKAMEQFPEFGLDKAANKTSAMRNLARLEAVVMNRFQVREAGVGQPAKPAAPLVDRDGKPYLTREELNAKVAEAATKPNPFAP